MEREQFDALAKLVWTKASRRTALGTVLSAAVLGQAPDLATAKPKPKDKQQRRRKRTKRKQGNNQSEKRSCYPGTRCIPGPARDNAGCDFSFSAVFRDTDASGSNLSKSSFRGADLRGADFRGADLGGACLVGASLEEAKLGSSVDLGGAIFCNTIMPDGSVDDSGCDDTDACCPPLEQDCPDGEILCSLQDIFGFCTQTIGVLGPFGRCSGFLCCAPCGHNDVDFWTSQCNVTFAECNGECVAHDAGGFPCFEGCAL